jgi:glycosyltransferase involved in cell wall biosynthesis
VKPIRSIVLPAYNEEGYIARMVERTVNACAQRDDPFEVIVVDNASTDATAQITTDIAAADPRVTLIHHPENRLYAGSCRTGTRAARGDRVFIIDSDGQHSPEDIWPMDRALDGGSDLVLGWRRRRSEPLPRIAMSRMLWLLARTYLGYTLHDVNCGIRGMSRAFVEQLEIAHRINLVNPELYVRARVGGFRIDEVEVVQEGRKAGTSSHDFARLWRTFREVNTYLWVLRSELRTGVLPSPPSSNEW